MSNKKLCKNMYCRPDAQRKDRLYDAVEQFDYSPELSKRVYHLGRPYFTNAVSTASLNITKKGKPVFSFNRDFFDSLGRTELVFVLLHETLHFVFCHHQRCGDRQPALWNIASDLVTNAFLLEKIGFAKVSSRGFQKFLETSITFANVPAVPASARQLNLTAEEVYDLLAENLQGILPKVSNLKACDEHVWPGSVGSSTSMQGGPSDEDLESNEEKTPNLEDSKKNGSSGLGSDDESEQNEVFDEIAEQAQRIFRNWLQGWGNIPSGELRAIGETEKPSGIDWDYILSRRIASCIKPALQQRWAPPNRKIAWLYPEVLLPADCEIEQYQSSVLMAIDASASIRQPVLARLLGIARSVPADRIELTAVSFDTRIYPVDIWEDIPAIRGGGGTSFQAIENFAEQLNRYPDMVVVLTDGCAKRPAVEHPKRWFWLITKDGTTEHVEGIGRCCKIDRITSVSTCQIGFRCSSAYLFTKYLTCKCFSES